MSWPLNSPSFSSDDPVSFSYLTTVWCLWPILILGFLHDFKKICFVVVPFVMLFRLLMFLNPVWLGIMIAINLQTQFLTRPFGFALFYFCSFAPPSLTTIQIYKDVIPFVAKQVVAFAVVALFPGLTTWLPSVILSS